MANPEHIKWLLEGVDSWNERRGTNRFEPDFEGANLYREFRNAGKLDRNRMIPLAGIMFDDANLKNVDLTNANLENAHLEFAIFTYALLSRANLSNAFGLGANFTNAGLYLANLSNAFLLGAEFVNANIRAANLTNAVLERADLTRTYLVETDFTNAVLINASITRAEIAYSNLKNADLTNVELKNINLYEATDLADANFAGTQPWEANLFSEDGNGFRRRRSGRRPPIKTVETLLKQINGLRKHHTDTYGEDFVLYFRGQAKHAWGLFPSVVRDKHLQASEGEMLRELIARRPEEFSGRIMALEQWVLAQHHGLPTRFLDITRNPLVALLNACQDDKYKEKSGALYIFAVPKSLVKTFDSDAISVIANLAKLTPSEQKLLTGSEENVRIPSDEEPIGSTARMRLYQQIRIEKPYFANRIDIRDLYKVFIVEPKQSSERIRAQSGAFLASAFHSRFERDEILRRNDRIPIYTDYKLEIPKEAKDDILEELELLNITNETLFPGLDSSAEAVKEMYSGSQSDTDASNDCGT